jgi:IclR family KDG regulon transcriptional repressor
MPPSDLQPGNRSRKTKVVQSVVRASKILKAFSSGKSELSITELSEIVDLPVSSVYRIVSSLESEQLIEQDLQSKRYHLSLEVFMLGRGVLNHMGLGWDALPHIKKLADFTGETVNMGALRHGNVVYLQRIETEHLVRANLPLVGVPAHCTAIGKILLAHLPEQDLLELISETGLERYGPNSITTVSKLKEELQITRERGFSIDDEEFSTNVRCIGAPIRDSNGTVIAGIAISAPANRLSYERLESLEKPILEAAARISHGLGYSPRE